jgi:nifR3 family TIM-barrel protein
MLNKLSNSQVMMAPMVGLSHYAVRQAVAEFLEPGQQTIWPTEMLSSRRLPYQNCNQTEEIIFDDRNNGLCPQLLGNEEKLMSDSIRKLEDWGAKAIDINMGCPVKRALQHNYGVALMGDSSYAARVTEIAVKNTKLPVSVKLRAGLQSDEKFLVDFVKRLESVGAAWITLHPRTAEQKRRGSADWNQIRLLKSVLKIPVVGNGDIQCPEDISAMMDETGCDRVMIGRALLAKPWLISYSSHSSYKELDSHAEAEFYGRFLKRVLQISRECYPEEKGLRKIRFLLYHGSVWLEYGHTLYALMKKAKNYQEASDYLEAFFLEPRKIFKRTALRH